MSVLPRLRFHRRIYAERNEALDRLDTFVAALEHVLEGHDPWRARKLLDNYYEALERKSLKERATP